MRGALALGLMSLLLLVGAFAAAEMAGRAHVLAAFTTDLSGRSQAQRTNIRAAAARLDGVTVPAGHTFSFNDVVGRRVLEQGYERAPAFEQGGVADVAGGGICQVSSTVYNAALLAGMRIVERSPHMRPVQSVGPGRDATVLYGKWDLRFVNSSDAAVRLRARVVGERLIVEVVGARPLQSAMKLTVERVASAGAPGGLRVRTWRTCDGKRECISEDTYLR